MAETVFSTFKRLFGEYASSIKFKYTVKEMMIKALLFNVFTSDLTNSLTSPRTERTGERP